MDADTIAARVARIRVQMERYLDFGAGATGALLVDNMDWTGSLSAIDFLRDVGKHFSVNVMLQRESVSARLESGGISYTEFSYVLLQSNDYLELYRRHGCRLQIGGNDQWGNITAGLDLIRRVEGHEASAHAMTTPLVTDSSGQKFGKSTGGGSLWLDPEMTSPYQLFQYFLGTDDRDVASYLRFFTFLPREELEALEAEALERPQARTAQRRLAQELVRLVHGDEEARRAEAAGQVVFGGDVTDLDEATLEAVAREVPVVPVPAGADVPAYVELLAGALGLSRSDARRAVREGGAYLNGARVEDEALVPAASQWLHGRFLVLRRGKRAVALAVRG